MLLGRKRFLQTVLGGISLVQWGRPSVVSAEGGFLPTTEIYGRMRRLNANLQSFQATMHVDVHLHSFPFLSSSLTGTAYFEMPDRYAVIFDTVPLLANSLKKVYPQLEPPSAWGTLYEVTQTDEDATSAQFRLVRRKNGRIDHVSVSVDQQTATVTSMAYFYKDGGSITFSQQYDQIDGLFVIKSQTGKVDIPRYSADLSSTFEHYQLNRPIDEKVFADS